MVGMAKQTAAKKNRVSSRRPRKKIVRPVSSGLAENLAQGLSHEIRSPLAAIKAALEVLLETEELSHQAKQIVAEIDVEIEQIDRVMRQFLDFTLCPQPHMEDIPLDALAESVCDQLKEKPPGFNLTVSVPKQLQVRGDIPMLQKVLAELTKNAIDHGADLVTIEGRVEEGKAVIQVRNSGAPIDKEITHRIFEPFFSTRTRRAGLGLSIAQRWVVAMNGTIKMLPARNGFEIMLNRGE